MKVLVPYADDDEVAKALQSPGVRVEAERVSPGVVELVEYAGVFPLVPYDQVTVYYNRVIGVHRLTMWVFDVFCRTPALIGAPSLEDPTQHDIAVEALDDDAWEQAKLGADQVIHPELARMALIHRDGYGVVVATESRVWFDAWRKDHPHVQFIQVMRTPDTTMSFETMQRTLNHDRETM